MKLVTSSLALFFKIIAVVIMSFFVAMSTLIICIAAFTEVTGYTVYGSKDNSEFEELYTYTYDEGEDTRLDEYEAEGYTLRISKQRSELAGIGNIVFIVVTQLICFIMLVAFVYSHLWKLGNKDFALVKRGEISEDRLKGLKIGLIASVPNFALYIWMIISAVFSGEIKASGAAYQLANYEYYPILSLILKKGTNDVYSLDFWGYCAALLITLIIPLIAWGSYVIGYKDIVLSEKLIYSKKKKNTENKCK